MEKIVIKCILKLHQHLSGSISNAAISLSSNGCVLKKLQFSDQSIKKKALDMITIIKCILFLNSHPVSIGTTFLYAGIVKTHLPLLFFIAYGNTRVMHFLINYCYFEYLFISLWIFRFAHLSYQAVFIHFVGSCFWLSITINFIFPFYVRVPGCNLTDLCTRSSYDAASHISTFI